MGARPIRDSTVPELRDQLTERCTKLMARFVESDGELFPYRGAELKRLQKRLDDLNSGRDVLVYRFEIPTHMQPPRNGHRHVFTLRGDRLIDAEYERCEVSVPSELGKRFRYLYVTPRNLLLIHQRRFRGGVPESRHGLHQIRHPCRLCSGEVPEVVDAYTLASDGRERWLEVGIGEHFVVQMASTPNRGEQQRLIAITNVGVHVVLDSGPNMRRHHNHPRFARLGCVNTAPTAMSHRAGNREGGTLHPDIAAT